MKFMELVEKKTPDVKLQDPNQNVAPNRFYAREPKLAAIRYYLSTFLRKHQHQLTKTEKNVVARQSKRFRLSSTSSLEYKCSNQQWRIYPETKDMRRQILTETHRYVTLQCQCFLGLLFY
jgi:oligoendopeptidase F